jgi:hypothetical protein
MPPKINWGSRLWTIIHMRALTYYPTVENSLEMKSWVYDLPNRLPCRACSAHFVQVLADDPIELALGCRTELVAWSNRIHNAVNAQTGKEQYPLELLWQNQISIVLSGLLFQLIGWAP